MPLRHGTRAVGLLAAASPTLDIGTLDAIAGVVAIAIERAAVPGRARRRRTGAAEGRPRRDAARLAQPRSAHAADRDQGRGRKSRRRSAADERRGAGSAAIAELDRLTRLLQDILDMARIDAAAIRVDRQWVPPLTSSMPPSRTSGTRSTGIRCASTRTPTLRSKSIRVWRRSRCRTCSRTRRGTRRATATIAVRARGRARRAARLGHRQRPRPRSGRARSPVRALLSRPDGARRSTFGTGMGLSITRGLLAAAGGRVWAENVAGRRRPLLRWSCRARSRAAAVVAVTMAAADPDRRRRAEHHRHRGAAAAGTRLRGVCRR